MGSDAPFFESRVSPRARVLSETVRVMGRPPLGPHACQDVLDAIDANGKEIAAFGTVRALDALTVTCPECDGEGSHQDDSHPGNAARVCAQCSGWGRVPRQRPLPDGAACTARMVERVAEALKGLVTGPDCTCRYDGSDQPSGWRCAQRIKLAERGLARTIVLALSAPPRDEPSCPDTGTGWCVAPRTDESVEQAATVRGRR